jgi:hypothetical protein
VSKDRIVYGEVVSNGIGGVCVEIEGAIYGPGVIGLSADLEVGDRHPCGFFDPGSSRRLIILNPPRRSLEFPTSAFVKKPTIVYGIWSQFEGNPQRNNSAHTPAEPRPFSGLTLTTLPDGIKFPHGLVAFKSDAGGILATSYYVKDPADGTKASKLVTEWYSVSSGLVVSHWEFRSATVFSAHLQSALAVNPANNHVIASPLEEQTLFATYQDSGHILQQQSTPYTDDLRMTSFAGQSILLAGCNYSYTPDIYSSEALSDNYPPSPYVVKTEIQEKAIVCLLRSETEGITSKWTIDPKTLATGEIDPSLRVCSSIVGDLNRGWPATLGNDYWLVGNVTKRTWDDSGDANKCVRAGYGVYTPGHASDKRLDPAKYADKYEATVTKLSASNGAALWTWKEVDYAALAGADSGTYANLVSYYTAALTARYGSLPASIVDTGLGITSNYSLFTSGWIPEGRVNGGTSAANTRAWRPTSFGPWPSSGYDGDGIGPSSMPLPSFNFARNASIVFMPRLASNNPFVGPPLTAGTYNSGDTPNIQVWTDYLQEPSTTEGAVGDITPGIYIDPDDDSCYFSLAIPSQFLHLGAPEMGAIEIQSRTIKDGGFTSDYESCLCPQVYNHWHLYGFCVDKDGSTRWSRDMGQYVGGCCATVTPPEIAERPIVSGTYSGDLQITDNVWMQSVSSALFILRDLHDLGANNSPSAYVELINKATGELLSTITLRVGEEQYNPAEDTHKIKWRWNLLANECTIRSSKDANGLAWAYIYAPQTDHDSPIAGTSPVRYSRHEVIHIVRVTALGGFTKTTIDATVTGQIVPLGSDEWQTVCVLADNLTWCKKVGEQVQIMIA